MKSGKELVREIQQSDVSGNTLSIWWLGQHSFVVKHQKTLLWLDPFLTPLPGRLVPPLLTPEDIPEGSIIFGSHDHADHIDRPAWKRIIRNHKDVTFVIPDILREGIIKDLQIPADRIIGIDDMSQKTIASISVTGIAAAHELLAPDSVTGQHHYLGFVIEIGDRTIYHSGDTCIYEGLETKLKHWHFDAALLPINGRDAKRLKSGCIGNMTYQEAADLAGALTPGITIPAHFEMFEGNTVDPQLFADYMTVKYPDLPIEIPIHGKRITVTNKKT